VPGKSHLAGDYKGVDNVIAQFMRNFEETNGTFQGGGA